MFKLFQTNPNDSTNSQFKRQVILVESKLLDDESMLDLDDDLITEKKSVWFNQSTGEVSFKKSLFNFISSLLK
jgi:hypothetical protein